MALSSSNSKPSSPLIGSKMRVMVEWLLIVLVLVLNGMVRETGVTPPCNNFVCNSRYTIDLCVGSVKIFLQAGLTTQGKPNQRSIVEAETIDLSNLMIQFISGSVPD